MPYARKLELVKEVARCSEHQGDNTWCWVDPNRNHIPLCLDDLQNWAKFLVCLKLVLIPIYLMALKHDECMDTTCVSPPKRLITNVTTTRMPRGSSLARTVTEPAIPVIHNHVYDDSTCISNVYILLPRPFYQSRSSFAHRYTWFTNKPYYFCKSTQINTDNFK
jgi:hypothetical protein